MSFRALAVRMLCIFGLLAMPNNAAAQLVNTGQVSGIPASGSLPLPLSQSTVTIPVVSAVETIELIKSVSLNDTNGDGHAQMGESLTYGFLIKNTGNVTLKNISVTDPMVTLSGGPIPSLAPGAADTSTFTAVHTLDAGDIASGSLSNQAAVKATSAKAGALPDAVTDMSDSANPADGPGLNDPTVLTFTDAPIIAGDDGGTLSNGSAGGVVAGLNVLANDTLNGAAAVAADVAIAPVSAGPLTANADGTVTVAPGTAAGTYLVAYQVCEVLNPLNCDDGSVSVTVDPAVLVATDDAVINVDGVAGGVISGLNVLGNDTMNGTALVPTAVSLAPVGNGPLTVNADGTVTVVPGTPGGSYLVTYEICEILNPANCATANLTVDVLAPTNKVSGVIYEDDNSNGVLDFTDTRAGGYTVQLVNNGVVVATAVSNPDGSYEFLYVPAGSGYSVASIDPDTGTVVTGRGTFDVGAGSVIADVTLPTDPSGVVYDSVTRQPVAGVVLTMTNMSGVTLPASCFASPAQQPQTTAADGNYRFDILAGNNSACPSSETEYRISISAPSAYVAVPSATIVPSPGTLDATTCPVDVVFGGSCAIQPQPTAPVGAAATTYFLAFLLQAGDPNVVHNHIPLDPAIVVPGNVSVTKVAKSQTGVRGGAMTYTVTATNNGGTVTSSLELIDRMPVGFTLIGGTVDVNGLPVTPTVDGRRIILPAMAIPGNGRVVIVLQLRIPSDAAPGTYENIAFAVDPATGEQIGTSGSATIRIKPEAVFDCGDVIGKVFDDKNANGYQDKGELGIPGVRLATVRGELITTDKNGQYHVPCAMLPDQKIGSNFILKLDPRTLPTGFRVTTENPRVIRLTAGKVSKLNFGASIGRVVRLDLRGDAFAIREKSLRPEWAAKLADLVLVLKDKNSVLRLTYFEDGETPELAKARVAEVRNEIEALWKKSGGAYKLPIEVELVKK